jgi:hypothetical protein
MVQKFCGQRLTVLLKYEVDERVQETQCQLFKEDEKERSDTVN